MADSLFITLEGGEGTGKTTLITALKEYLLNHNFEVVLTREPGGTEGAEAIRDLLVRGSANRWNVMSEICLFYAAREDHLERVIRPALDANKIVICDRFFDSTRAYQGNLGQYEANVIKCLEDNIVGPTKPDITLILDIDPEIGLRRAASRNDDEGRFETKNIEFHKNLRQAFLNIAKNEPTRCKVIDASLSAQLVYEKAIELINSLLEVKTK